MGICLSAHDVQPTGNPWATHDGNLLMDGQPMMGLSGLCPWAAVEPVMSIFANAHNGQPMGCPLAVHGQSMSAHGCPWVHMAHGRIDQNPTTARVCHFLLIVQRISLCTQSLVCSRTAWCGRILFYPFFDCCWVCLVWTPRAIAESQLPGGCFWTPPGSDAVP